METPIIPALEGALPEDEWEAKLAAEAQAAEEARMQVRPLRIAGGGVLTICQVGELFLGRGDGAIAVCRWGHEGADAVWAMLVTLAWDQKGRKLGSMLEPKPVILSVHRALCIVCAAAKIAL